MKKKPHETDITEEERQIFQAYVKGVQPLKGNHTQTVSTSPTAPKRTLPPISIRQRAPHVQALDVGDPTPLVQSEDSLQFAHSGVQHHIIQKMRRGEINIEAELDLHGMNLDQAEEQLSRFLINAVEAGWRYILVIHGKGAYQESPYPILKNKVNQWLRAHSHVLAFCSANPFQGGVGAVYVLLKRSRFTASYI
ncbi:MAG: mismatch repair protein MutS [Gammaproteobacteria bacterium]|nr:mismatch repair protein MutS [Gammaproteobacteria bacterium]